MSARTLVHPLLLKGNALEWYMDCNSSPLRGQLGHDGYDIILGVLPHYRDPAPLLVLGKMPRNFTAKREETRSMVGPVDEA